MRAAAWWGEGGAAFADTGELLTHLEAPASLRELSLDSCRLDWLPENVAVWPQLHVLDLFGNRWAGRDDNSYLMKYNSCVYCSKYH